MVRASLHTSAARDALHTSAARDALHDYAEHDPNFHPILPSVDNACLAAGSPCRQDTLVSESRIIDYLA